LPLLVRRPLITLFIPWARLLGPYSLKEYCCSRAFAWKIHVLGWWH
jgi:hypothetical protein